jgi:hypothetical protein
MSVAPAGRAEPSAFRVYATSESAGTLAVIDGDSGRVI